MPLSTPADISTAALEAAGVEITHDLVLSEAQRTLLDMHSLLNTLNVLAAEFYFLGEYLHHPDGVGPASRLARTIADGLSDRPNARLHVQQMEHHIAFLHAEIARARLEAAPERQRLPEVEQTIDNIISVLGVLGARAREILTWLDAPMEWTTLDVGRLTASLKQFLSAIAQNSRGRYRIVYDPAEQTATDYLVRLHICGTDDATISMPPVLQDVLRDLTANARKYTHPGGRVTVGLVDNGSELCCIVEDDGRGIPADQIEAVVTFGTRGRNMSGHATRGGGFGLTKAYVVTRQLGGRMWIWSEESRGTRITLRIPRPGRVKGKG